MLPTLPLDEMTLEEKLQTMESLWDSLCHESREIQSPDWHRDVLEARLRKVQAGQGKFLSLEELKAKHRK